MPDKSNVLLICFDQMRGDFLGCNGHPTVMTPHIDQIANEGINFRQAFSECPVCVPARRIIMTGLSTYSIHMNRNAENQPFTEGPKLAEIMTRAGYQTFASGKLHTHPKRNRIGFEEVQLNEEGRKIDGVHLDDYEQFLVDKGFGHLLYTHGMGNNQCGFRYFPLPSQYTSTRWTADKAMEFIERRDPTRPFFLYVSFDKPHPPLTPPREFYELYEQVDMPEPSYGEWADNKTPLHTRWGRLRHNYSDIASHRLIFQQTLRAYAALITEIDSAIGTLLGTLREHNLLDDTTIIIISDHGDNMYDHGNIAKYNFLKGSCNIPYIIRPASSWIAKTGFSQGQINTTTPAGLSDIMPTILDICGIKVPDHIDGQSLCDVMLGNCSGFRKITFGNCNTCYASFDGRFKYLWYSDDGTELLFDTIDDNREMYDLADKAEYPDVKNYLKNQLISWTYKNNDKCSNGKDLIIVPYDRGIKTAHAKNPWNNRGRH